MEEQVNRRGSVKFLAWQPWKAGSQEGGESWTSGHHIIITRKLCLSIWLHFRRFEVRALGLLGTVGRQSLQGK